MLGVVVVVVKTLDLVTCGVVVVFYVVVAYFALKRFFTPLASIISSVFMRLVGLEPSSLSAYGDD